ncbi:MAG: retropepsin-like domain-containing protein [Thermoplasmata archaeon]|nr:MAG: retropepsin-like domain-containing protein [Thermoplasmata archaeon]
MRFNIDSSEPFIVLPVGLVGKSAKYIVNMALDTGATFVMIPWDVAEHLGYDPAISEERISITTASTVEKVPLITIKEMEVLGRSKKNVKVAVHDLPPKSRLDGLLGLSFLNDFNLKLMFKRGYLELEE